MGASVLRSVARSCGHAAAELEALLLGGPCKDLARRRLGTMRRPPEVRGREASAWTVSCWLGCWRLNCMTEPEVRPGALLWPFGGSGWRAERWSAVGPDNRW
ncbi:hypothetical protein NDU88_011602 [Pleurodeles waltl]|uniref:Uncharacterized protein n=1 Tax=Pleurodeles waltl TaxID=8319 RepID=A0AAV7QZ22_PLEWA|nr:hypothetical protein NDU88_011602 [Pleurodeles waltl]